jgi:hypothetical protein
MSNINAKNYKGRVWTCDQHNNKIEAMINDGETEKAMNLVAILDPKQGRGICKECSRLWKLTPSFNR